MSDDITTIRQSQLDRIMQAVEWVETEKYTRAGTELVAAANLNQTQPEPAWHDRPPVPGRWMLVAEFGNADGIVIRIENTEAHTEQGRRWFGPIPPDPKAHE